MDEGVDYEMTIALISSADTEQSRSTATIDIDAVLANRIDIRSLDYSEVDKLFERLEGRRIEVAPEPVPEPRVQEQVLVEKHPLAKERVSAAKGLSGMAGGVGKEIGESVSREKIGMEKLIMPKLSVQDQLSDLEKITEGIDEGIFDKDQTKIIVEEVKGLYAIAMEEDTSKLSEDQKELVLIRDQKVREIKNKLRIR